MELEIIGVPFNSAGRSRGVAGAPSALYAKGLLSQVRSTLPDGWTANDGGDVSSGAPSQLRDPKTALCNSEALDEMIAGLSTAVIASRTAGRLPLVLGGDCAVLLGALWPGETDETSGPLGLLFVDGHEDAWPPPASPTGEAADSELGLLLNLDPDLEVPAALADRLPLMEPDAMALLGARDAEELAGAEVETLRGRVLVFQSASELIDASIEDVTRDALVAIRKSADRWWLHVDLDVLSTEALPAVDYLQPGGLSWEQLTALTRTAVATPGLVGWSVTIYNPDLDLDRTGAARIVEYLAESLAVLPTATAAPVPEPAPQPTAETEAAEPETVQVGAPSSA
jgi:arginase